MKKVIGLILIEAVLFGCATYTNVNINTNVPEAKVVVDGQIVGQSPINSVKIKNQTGKTYQVIIEKEGYETYQGYLAKESKPGATTAVIVGYVFSWLLLPMLLWIYGAYLDGPVENQYFILKEAN